MIEQTPIEVTIWTYIPPPNGVLLEEQLNSHIEMQVMKKRNEAKKGLAIRFICKFKTGQDPLLEYIAGDSYLMDFDDQVDRSELMTMVHNSYQKFCTAFDLRKGTTVLGNKSLLPFNDHDYDWEPVLDLLK